MYAWAQMHSPPSAGLDHYTHRHTYMQIYVYMYMFIHLCLFIFNQRQSDSRARIAPSNLPADQECPCPWYSPWQFFLPTRVYKYCAYDCISKGTKDVIYIHVYITTYHTCTQIHIHTCEYLHTHKNILIRTCILIHNDAYTILHTYTYKCKHEYIHTHHI